MRRAQPLGGFAGGEVVAGLIGHPRHLGVQHGEVDVLALPVACGIAVVQGSHDGEGGPHAGADVGDGDADLLRVAAQVAGDAHQTADTLHDLVVGRAVAVRSRGPKAGDGTVDDGRVDLLYVLVGQVEVGHHVGGEVLNDDVGVGGQLQEDLLRFFVAQVEGQAALVAVDVQEIRGLFPDEGRPPLAGVVPNPGALDFDDIGAVVAQHEGAEGTRQGAGQVEHFDAFQWFHIAVSPPPIGPRGPAAQSGDIITQVYVIPHANYRLRRRRAEKPDQLSGVSGTVGGRRRRCGTCGGRVGTRRPAWI